MGRSEGIVAMLKERVYQLLVRWICTLLDNWEVRKRIQGQGIEHYLAVDAEMSTARYVRQNMMTVAGSLDRWELLAKGAMIARQEGLWLEFGVGEGHSVRFIAGLTKNTVHGFDSFHGLPEFWREDFDVGRFSTHGQLPPVPSNVQLHAGLFEETVPLFRVSQTGPISFLHVDCDLYSSTKKVFDILGNGITQGTVIVFDEYFNYPGWEDHEFKAFQELVNERKIRYKYITYGRGLCQGVTVQIL